jgi:hypothetical protein
MHLPLTLDLGHPRCGEKALEKMPISKGIFDREAALVGLPSFDRRKSLTFNNPSGRGEPYLGCPRKLDMTQPGRRGELAVTY